MAHASPRERRRAFLATEPPKSKNASGAALCVLVRKQPAGGISRRRLPPSVAVPPGGDAEISVEPSKIVVAAAKTTTDERGSPAGDLLRDQDNEMNAKKLIEIATAKGYASGSSRGS